MGQIPGIESFLFDSELVDKEGPGHGIAQGIAENSGQYSTSN